MAKVKIGNIDCEEIPSLQPVLSKWICLNREIANIWRNRGESPWWFNERAAVSVLAGAVSKCGKNHYAFEEFVDEKHRTHKRSVKYQGRVDLYINLNGEEFIAEAKICWPKAEKDNDAMIVHHLSKAEHDVKECELDGQKRLAIVFAALSVKKTNADKIDKLILRWTEKVKAVGDVRAWTFPRSARQTEGKRHFHPGIAVFIKEV